MVVVKRLEGATPFAASFVGVMLLRCSLLFLAAVACTPIQAAFVSAPFALRSHKSPTKCGLIRMSVSGTAVSAA